MSWVITPSFYGYITDANAKDYLSRVHAAEGQTLEPAVALAIEAFIVGCKTDGIWTAIKASCILAGTRTLSGALVPLVGPTPINNNFTASDYNRKTGLIGNRLTKYLQAGLLDNSQAQNNFHLSAYVLDIGDAPSGWIGTFSSSFIFRSASNTFNSRNRAGSTNSTSGVANAGLPYLAGVSRAGSANYTERRNKGNFTVSSLSVAPSSEEFEIFKSAGNFGNPRLAFYSIGESLDLALLDARVTTLVNAFAAAIP